MTVPKKSNAMFFLCVSNFFFVLQISSALNNFETIDSNCKTVTLSY